MNRRTFLTTLIATPTLGAVVAACGDSSTIDSSDQPGTSSTGSPGTVPPSTNPPSTAPSSTGAGGSAGIDHPTGADDVILRLGYEGGFVPVGTAFVNLPTVLIAGDGRLVRPGAQTMIYPGPLLPPITSATITEEGVQRILALAREQGLLAPAPDYSTKSLVADAPDTVLTIAANGQTFEHVAPALGLVPGPDGAPAEETSEARRKLDAFVQAIIDISTAAGPGAVGVETMIEGGPHRLQARPAALADYAGQDPQPTVVPWPAGADVALTDSLECATTASADVLTALQAATSLTLFDEAGRLFQVAAVAQLPGDPAC